MQTIARILEKGRDQGLNGLFQSQNGPDEEQKLCFATTTARNSNEHAPRLSPNLTRATGRQ